MFTISAFPVVTGENTSTNGQLLVSGPMPLYLCIGWIGVCVCVCVPAISRHAYLLFCEPTYEKPYHMITSPTGFEDDIPSVHGGNMTLFPRKVPFQSPWTPMNSR